MVGYEDDDNMDVDSEEWKFMLFSFQILPLFMLTEDRPTHQSRVANTESAFLPPHWWQNSWLSFPFNHFIPFEFFKTVHHETMADLILRNEPLSFLLWV